MKRAFVSQALKEGMTRQRVECLAACLSNWIYLGCVYHPDIMNTLYRITGVPRTMSGPDILDSDE